MKKGYRNVNHCGSTDSPTLLGFAYNNMRKHSLDNLGFAFDGPIDAGLASFIQLIATPVTAPAIFSFYLAFGRKYKTDMKNVMGTPEYKENLRNDIREYSKRMSERFVISKTS